jgi:hypothetical protein
LGFEGVVVGDNFGDFVGRADGGNEGRDVHYRPQRLAKAISEG